MCFWNSPHHMTPYWSSTVMSPVLCTTVTFIPFLQKFLVIELSRVIPSIKKGWPLNIRFWWPPWGCRRVYAILGGVTCLHFCVPSTFLFIHQLWQMETLKAHSLKSTNAIITLFVSTVMERNCSINTEYTSASPLVKKFSVTTPIKITQQHFTEILL